MSRKRFNAEEVGNILVNDKNTDKLRLVDNEIEFQMEHFDENFLKLLKQLV